MGQLTLPVSYEELWSNQLSVRLGPWLVEEDLRHWVNDGLMSLFFLLGLEIKRELLTGELRDLRTAAVPVVASIGGMIVPIAKREGCAALEASQPARGGDVGP